MALDTATVRERSGPARTRSALLPGYGGLLVLDLCALLLHGTTAFTVLIAASIIFLGYMALRTRDAVRNHDRLSHADQVLLRWSGVLAPIPLCAFLGTAYSLEALGFNVNVVIFGHELGWGVVASAFELGFVLALAAIVGGKSVKHVAPSLLWRGLAIPLIGIYGLYVFGTVTRGFGDSLHR